MGTVVPIHQARASAGSKGYKSGRRSCRETPEICSTASTLSGGTSSHCETACIEMPSGPASPAKPPTALIARSSASLRSVIMAKSSMALPRSQASLHCNNKAVLYYVDMTIGKRIKLARELRGLGQEQVAKAAGTSKQSVHQWEQKGTRPDLDKLNKLREVLKVTFVWLLEGGDTPPPAADDPEVLLEDRMVKLLRRERSGAA